MFKFLFTLAIRSTETSSTLQVGKYLFQWRLISLGIGYDIHIVMSYNSNVTNLAPRCAFWNTSGNKWSFEGCELMDHNAVYSTCMCNHLTNFAIIMDVNGNLDDQKDVSNSKSLFNVVEYQRKNNDARG